MAKRALGTTIKINGVLIGGLTNINPPERTADTIDTTTLDSSDGYKDFIQGFKDGGEVSISGFYDPAYTGLTQIDNAYENGTEDTYIITFPTSIGATFTFTGIVTNLKSPGEATIDDPLGFEATIKVKGKPVLATTPSVGISALSLSGGGAISPTVSANTLNYTYTFTAQTSITITPTAANHTIKLLVDDVYVQDLNSGATSAAITGFTAQSAKKITLMCSEAGKTPKIYTIVASRST